MLWMQEYHLTKLFRNRQKQLSLFSFFFLFASFESSHNASNSMNVMTATERCCIVLLAYELQESRGETLTYLLLKAPEQGCSRIWQILMRFHLNAQ